MSRRRKAVLAALGAVGILVLAVTAPAASAAPGDVTVVPLQITGPPSDRLNLIILGDGYQAHEMQKFRDDTDRNQNVMWSVEPFRSYRHYFNIYRVEIVSQDSGVRCDPDDREQPEQQLKTRRCGCGTTDGCTTTPSPAGPRTARAPSGGGCPARPTADRRRTAARHAETHEAPGVLRLPANAQNVQTLAIFNSFTYGGIGGTQATTSGGSPQGPLISTHELGHSLGQMADEYPYTSRDVVRNCYTGGEPGSFHHTIRTNTQSMIDDQFKWWRWIGEESLSGGVIGLHEGGNTFPCGIRRPSEHSMMRWIGFYFDQVGREHMTYRITGRRNANAMALSSTPVGEVGPDDVLWVETQHPKYDELDVTWRVNGEVVPGTDNSRNLELADLDLAAGAIVDVTVQDATEFVRDPAFKNGPRMTQTRSWTVGAPLPTAPVPVAFTLSHRPRTPGGRRGCRLRRDDASHGPRARRHLAARRRGGRQHWRTAGTSTWVARALAAGTHELSATVTDPAGPGGTSETRTWTVDNVAPTAPRTLSEPLTSVTTRGAGARRVLRRVRHAARAAGRPGGLRRRRAARSTATAGSTTSASRSSHSARRSPSRIRART